MYRNIAKIALIAAAAALLLPTAASAGDAVAGKTAYEQNCASCHGPTGKGDGPVGALLDPRPRDFTVGEFKYDTDGDGTAGTDADLTNIIKNGAAKYGGNALMAPLGHLDDTTIANIIAYTRTLLQ